MTFITPTSILNYVKSQSFQYFLPDWSVTIFLIIFFFIVEHSPPFHRQFSLSDLKISHPFAIEETITGPQCIIIATFIPITIILSTIFIKHYQNKYQSSHQALHLLQLSILGLFLSLSLSGVITDVLKNWIARHRPDFLSRCIPKIGTPIDQLVGVEVCTNTNTAILNDGMRSTPSGHSSISFGGLFFVTLWIFGQFKLVNNKQNPQYLYKYVIASLPVSLATWIALSRTQDYRHHFEDIVIGTVLGLVFATWSYFHYFNSLWEENCDGPIEVNNNEGDSLLPR